MVVGTRERALHRHAFCPARDLPLAAQRSQAVPAPTARACDGEGRRRSLGESGKGRGHEGEEGREDGREVGREGRAVEARHRRAPERVQEKGLGEAIGPGGGSV